MSPDLARAAGLALDPPERAVVLSGFDATRVRALDRPLPHLPLRPGFHSDFTRTSAPMSSARALGARRPGPARAVRALNTGATPAC